MENDKKVIRRQMKELVAALPEEYIRDSGRAIAEKLLSTEEYKTAKSVFVYYSVGREPDTVNIIKKALADGKKVSLPLVREGGVMEARRIYGLDGLVTNDFGIPEPPDTAETVPPEKPDVIVVPAAAVDGDLYRLGRGGGYYDRYLRKTDAFSVGLVRSSETVEKLPREWNDVPLDCVITEKGIKKRGAPKSPAR